MHATATLPRRPDTDHRVAPWWMGYLFLSPLRRLLENPRKLLASWVSPGDRVVEVGCGMGFFSLELARLAGPSGRVHAVDIQPQVLAALDRRAAGAGLDDVIETRLGTGPDPAADDLTNRVDFVHLHHTLHEVEDAGYMVGKLAAALRVGGLLYLAEPVGHVSQELFHWERALLREAGLQQIATPRGFRQQIAVFRKIA